MCRYFFNFPTEFFNKKENLIKVQIFIYNIN